VQDVVVGRGSARFDRPVMEWFARHREPWLTKVMWVVTTFGSSAVLIPLGLAVGVWYWWRRGTPRPFVLLSVAYVGSELLSETVRALSRRDRPPAALAAGHFAGFAFPSGHATHSVAVYGMLAVVLSASAPLWRRKVAIWTGAFSIATAVGISRLYLGAHWLTDVLGGFALGNLWLFLVVVAARAIPSALTKRSSSRLNAATPET
jgi:undecaprenyl-diphosphatase